MAVSIKRRLGPPGHEKAAVSTPNLPLPSAPGEVFYNRTALSPTRDGWGGWPSMVVIKRQPRAWRPCPHRGIARSFCADESTNPGFRM